MENHQVLAENIKYFYDHFLCRKLLNYQRVIDVEISTKDQKPLSTDNSWVGLFH